MKVLWEKLSSLGAEQLMYIVLAVMGAFVIYWIVRHLICGAGAAVRTLGKMTKVMDKLNAGEKRNYQLIDDIKRGKAVSKLWEPFYTCHFCGASARPADFFAPRSVKAVTGFSGAFIIPVIMILVGGIAAIYAKIHYMSGYAYLQIAGITAVLAVAVLVAWVGTNSRINNAAVTFIAVADCMLPVHSINGELKDVVNTLSKLPNIISNSATPVATKQAGGLRGGKDLEVQVIESIIEACIRKMDDTFGERFEKLNTAINSSTRAQQLVADKLRNIINNNDSM